VRTPRFISIALFILINVLFVDKYTARITEWHALVSIAYALFTLGVLFVLPQLLKRIHHPQRWLWVLACGLILTGIGIQYAIDPMGLQVDRWSAIHHFLDGMLEGTYPYGQQTHLGGYGSPFPVWQVLHIPFYALGNVGLSIFIILGLYIFSVWRIYGDHVGLVATVLLLLSPAIWYEIAVRSDLITNIMFVAILVEWLMYYRIELREHAVALAILAGLLLSTRLVAVIPLAVVYGYAFLKLNWKKQCLFIGVVATVFALTMLPFLFWEGSTLLFFEYNPFVLQTRQGSILALGLFAAIAIGITIFQKENLQLRHVVTGGLLSCLVVIAFVEKMWIEDTWNALYSSMFDITYLSLALPFYIIAISRFEVKC
jgi:hypothetical protein